MILNKIKMREKGQQKGTQQKKVQGSKTETERNPGESDDDDDDDHHDDDADYVANFADDCGGDSGDGGDDEDGWVATSQFVGVAPSEDLYAYPVNMYVYFRIYTFRAYVYIK